MVMTPKEYHVLSLKVNGRMGGRKGHGRNKLRWKMTWKNVEYKSLSKQGRRTVSLML